MPLCRGWFGSRCEQGRWERTGFDYAVDEPPVLLPLYADATGVLPVTGVGLVDFVQGAESEAVSSFCNVLAEGPPDALLAGDPAFASAIGSLCVDVYWIYASPSGAGMRVSEQESGNADFLYGVMSVIVFDGGLEEGPRAGRY